MSSDKVLYILIGERIKDLRKDHANMKQEDLAKEIGVQTNTISRWETATYKPSASELQKLAHFFKISISEFFPNDLNNDQNKITALARATGDLPEEDLEELVEYFKYRRARRVLNQSKK